MQEIDRKYITRIIYVWRSLTTSILISFDLNPLLEVQIKGLKLYSTVYTNLDHVEKK